MDIRIRNKSRDVHVPQSLPQFSRVYAGRHFELGITTAAAAENMNWMIRNGLGIRQCSLVQGREHFMNRGKARQARCEPI
jgi:hypothetical protein